jgi:tRNA-dihydrouridine synthase
MAYKYKAQIKNFDGFIKEFNLEKELAAVEKSVKADAAAAEARQEHLGSDDYKKLSDAFAIMEKIKWDEPVKRGRRVYDDAKFFESLKKQSDDGRVLSEKQIEALRKMAMKYIDRIEDSDKLKELLSLDDETLKKEKEQAVEVNEEVESALEFLGNITQWNEPEKRGKRVYDDKAFYESIKSQYESGKKLSGRQVYALKKMVEKYSEKTAK